MERRLKRSLRGALRTVHFWLLPQTLAKQQCTHSLRLYLNYHYFLNKSCRSTEEARNPRPEQSNYRRLWPSKWKINSQVENRELRVIAR